MVTRSSWIAVTVTAVVVELSVAVVSARPEPGNRLMSLLVVRLVACLGVAGILRCRRLWHAALPCRFWLCRVSYSVSMYQSKALAFELSSLVNGLGSFLHQNITGWIPLLFVFRRRWYFCERKRRIRYITLLALSLSRDCYTEELAIHSTSSRGEQK